MANPQPDQFTKISNELIEAFAKIRISGEAMQVLWAIFRKTYGWKKKDDLIPLSQFVLMTGLKRPTICRAISKLINLNIIKKDNGKIAKYMINKDYDTWKPLSKKITVIKKDNPVIKKDNETLSKKIHSKETTKETYSKENKYPENSIEFQLFMFCKNKILENFPNLNPPNSKNSIYKQCDCINKLIQIDKKTEHQIKIAVNFATEDEFWKENFQSALKLRRTNKDGIKYIDVFLSKADDIPYRKPIVWTKEEKLKHGL